MFQNVKISARCTVAYSFEDAILRDELSAPPAVDLQSVAQVRGQELHQKEEKTGSVDFIRFRELCKHRKEDIKPVSIKSLVLFAFNLLNMTNITTTDMTEELEH